MLKNYIKLYGKLYFTKLVFFFFRSSTNGFFFFVCFLIFFPFPLFYYSSFFCFISLFSFLLKFSWLNRVSLRANWSIEQEWKFLPSRQKQATKFGKPCFQKLDFLAKINTWAQFFHFFLLQIKVLAIFLKPFFSKWKSEN